MKQGIVVCGYGKNEEALKNLLKNLEGYTKYPIFVYINDACSLKDIHAYDMYDAYLEPGNKWETGAIQAAMDKKDWDEILFLTATMEIKDRKLFDIVFEECAGRSVALTDWCVALMVKFRREILSKMKIPITTSRFDSVFYEYYFLIAYRNIAADNFETPFISHVSKLEDKFGRPNEVVETDFIVKWRSLPLFDLTKYPELVDQKRKEEGYL